MTELGETWWATDCEAGSLSVSGDVADLLGVDHSVHVKEDRGEVWGWRLVH